MDKNLVKGAIYYTDFHVDPKIHGICLDQLKKSFGGEIVFVSLGKPMDVKNNVVLEGERSNTTMIRQIIAGLKNSKADIVFFTEHDVLYNPTHFEFTPVRNDIFYYNLSIYRWDYPNDRAISYDNLTSLSQMCCYRELALEHYQKRLKRIIDSGWDKEDGIGKMQPIWVRMLGYEPGTKRRKIGGFSDDTNERWSSKLPNVDIRHGQTLSNPKTHLSQFKHLPTGWRESALKEIPGWDLKGMFNL